MYASSSRVRVCSFGLGVMLDEVGSPSSSSRIEFPVSKSYHVRVPLMDALTRLDSSNNTRLVAIPATDRAPGPDV